MLCKVFCILSELIRIFYLLLCAVSVYRKILFMWKCCFILCTLWFGFFCSGIFGWFFFVFLCLELLSYSFLLTNKCVYDVWNECQETSRSISFEKENTDEHAATFCVLHVMNLFELQFSRHWLDQWDVIT